MKALFLLLSVVVFSFLFTGCNNAVDDFEGKIRQGNNFDVFMQPHDFLSRSTAVDWKARITRFKREIATYNSEMQELRKIMDRYRCTPRRTSDEASIYVQDRFCRLKSEVEYLQAKITKLQKKLSDYNKARNSTSLADIAYVKEFPIDCSTIPLYKDSPESFVLIDEILSVEASLKPVTDELNLNLFSKGKIRRDFHGTLYVYKEAISKDSLLSFYNVEVTPRGKVYINYEYVSYFEMPWISSVRKLIFVYLPTYVR